MLMHTQVRVSFGELINQDTLVRPRTEVQGTAHDSDASDAAEETESDDSSDGEEETERVQRETADPPPCRPRRMAGYRYRYRECVTRGCRQTPPETPPTCDSDRVWSEVR